MFLLSLQLLLWFGRPNKHTFWTTSSAIIVYLTERAVFQDFSKYSSSKSYLLSICHEPGVGGAKCFTCMVIFKCSQNTIVPILHRRR